MTFARCPRCGLAMSIRIEEMEKPDTPWINIVTCNNCKAIWNLGTATTPLPPWKEQNP